jgi:HK97 family phage prohead protease
MKPDGLALAIKASLIHEQVRNTAMNIERRLFVVESLSIVEADDGRGAKKPVIRGHAAVFNQLSDDLGGFREQIVPGAFSEAIERDDVRALVNHESSKVLGRNKSGTLRMSEDATGLLVEIDPPDTSYARDLLESMRRGDITQMSFGFGVKPGGQDWAKDDEGRTIRTLKKLRLFDVSPVTYPAYPQTDVAVRSYQEFQDQALAAYREHLMRMRLALAERVTA